MGFIVVYFMIDLYSMIDHLIPGTSSKNIYWIYWSEK